MRSELDDTGYRKCSASCGAVLARAQDCTLESGSAEYKLSAGHGAAGFHMAGFVERIVWMGACFAFFMRSVCRRGLRREQGHIYIDVLIWV